MNWKTLSGAGALVACHCVLTTNLTGAGFALQEHSVSGLGNAFAGGAAIAEDATTVYFNPAGLTTLEDEQVAFGVHWVLPEATYSDEGTTTLGTPTQGGGAVSDEDALLPNLFYARPIGDRAWLGIGVSAPFGLATRYEEGWVGRYVALDTELETVAFNPSLAYEVNDKFSIGGGISYVDATATLSNAVDFGLVFLSQFQAGGIPSTPQTQAIAADIQANLGSTAYDGSLNLNGDGDGWACNFGLHYEANDNLRWGFHYRGGAALNLSGTADFEVGALSAILGPGFQDQGGKVDIQLPDTFSFSVWGKPMDKLSLMADITRTTWSDFQNLVIQFDNPSPPDTVIPELWKDVNKYSVGASYELSPTLTGRIGMAYDESPVPNDEYRSPRIPDEDRTWLSLGLTVKAGEKLDLHVSYLKIFVDDPTIDNATHSAGQRLLGRIDADVDLLSFGATKRF